MFTSGIRLVISWSRHTKQILGPVALLIEHHQTRGLAELGPHLLNMDMLLSMHQRYVNNMPGPCPGRCKQRRQAHESAASTNAPGIAMLSSSLQDLAQSALSGNLVLDQGFFEVDSAMESSDAKSVNPAFTLYYGYYSHTRRSTVFIFGSPLPGLGPVQM